MRIVGFVIVNGQRVPVDWSITGTEVEHSVGLSADNVKVFVNLPTYVGEDVCFWSSEDCQPMATKAT
mgnify:CR=1 FL=1